MPTAIQREAQAIKSEAKIILIIVVLISLLVYLFSGTTQVAQEQTGLLIRFGKVAKTLTPGLHWAWPWPIDKIIQIPTAVSHSLEVKNFNLDPQLVSQRMTQLGQNKHFETLRGLSISALADPYLVTGDLNVVHLDLVVVYNISDPEAYYLAAGDFEDVSQTNIQNIARKIIANALIQTVAQMEIMDVLRESQAIQRSVQKIAQPQFDRLELGITIEADAVRVTNSLVPIRVQDVFNQVTTAMQARDNLIYIAKTDAKRIEDGSTAEVASILAEANIYAEATVEQAKGDAQRYKELINEYHDQGEVVRDRLRNEKLAEVAPYFKAPTIHAISDTGGKQKLVITIPGEPE